MRVLITGGSGFFALNWAVKRRNKDEILLALNKRSINIEGARCVFVNILSELDTERIVDAFGPDYIINAAAITNVEFCEAHRGDAILANYKVAEKLASIAERNALPLAHISTDHMTDGLQPYADEKSSLRPLNTYSETKMLGEDAVLNICTRALIVRTNFFGWSPKYRETFAEWVLKSLRESTRINLYEDVYFNPIYVGELVEIIQILLRKRMFGIFNVSTDEQISKFEFGLRPASLFGLDPNDIARARYDNADKTKRPLDMSLSNLKVKRAIGAEKIKSSNVADCF